MEEYKYNEITVVMESVLYQAPIIHLLHMDVQTEAILTFIEKIESRLIEFNCSFVFLYQEDPSVGIKRMMNTRGGKEWLNSTFERYKHEPYYVNHSRSNPESHLGFLQEYAEVARDAYVRCSLRSLSIDNSDWDWTSYHAQILDHFGWSYIPDPIVPVSELVKYVGVYRSDELGFNAHVEIKDGQLIVFGDQRLKVKEPNTFYLDHVSILISFLMDPMGECNHFVVKEKDLVGNHKDQGTMFRRIS
ncbi:hypothetical protein [Paenibacillus thermotolerans]|uniref:hypothetical protein n=1 Tax=Paenibacillus thermotolerans TaxID=3027807 RepID=UPI0023679B92|nr:MULTISPECIES: hypothetical protein [unclassified Paenibacillus]